MNGTEMKRILLLLLLLLLIQKSSRLVWLTNKYIHLMHKRQPYVCKWQQASKLVATAEWISEQSTLFLLAG